MLGGLIMGLYGIGKGIFKIVKGVATGEGDEIIKGIKKTAVNTVTTIATNEAAERITNDDDEDD
jgi:hypothetical protein